MLDKAIQHGKEYRKPYYRSARYDKTCRPHGGCPYCYDNRMHKHRRQDPVMQDDDITNEGNT